LCEDIDKEGFTRSYPLCMPLLMELHWKHDKVLV
jgi:hypothetical protein